MRWLLGLFVPHWKRAVFSALLVIVRSVLLLCPPLLVRSIIDKALPSAQGNLLIIASIGIVAIPIVTGAMIIWDLYVSGIALSVAAKVRSDLYNGLQHQPLEWLAGTKTGELIARLQRETEQVFLFVYQGYGSFTWFNVTIAIGLGMMAWLEWRLTLTVICLLIFQSWSISQLGEKVKKASQNVAVAHAGIVEHMRETTTGAVFIKYAGLENRAIDQLSRHLDEHFRAYRRHLALERTASVVKAVMAGLLPATIYLWGGIMVMNGHISTGSLVALVSLYTWIQPAVFGYQGMYLAIMRVSVNVARLREILFPARVNGGTARPAPPLSMQLLNVSFTYGGERNVLQNISLKIPSGRTIAIVGPSGCGKSTLADLLLGLRTPDSGQVLLGPEPLGKVDQEWLRRHVVAVSQDVQVRSGTLRENVTFGNPEASDEEVSEALQAVALHDWIQTLPNGLETRVGEQGLQISGGERQRLSLARALLRRPSILILDEATSALDTLTERQVMANLRHKLQGCTFVIIAHRLSTVVDADRIYVLADGKVVEAGSHPELMRAGGMYASLYQRQIQHGE